MSVLKPLENPTICGGWNSAVHHMRPSVTFMRPFHSCLSLDNSVSGCTDTTGCYAESFTSVPQILIYRNISGRLYFQVNGGYHSRPLCCSRRSERACFRKPDAFHQPVLQNRYRARSRPVSG